MTQQRAPTQRLIVRNDRCRRYGTCEWEAPELFQLKPNGGMRYRRDVLPDQLDRARAAVRACPMVAIVLVER